MPRVNKGELDKILWDNGQEDWREVVYVPTPVSSIVEGDTIHGEKEGMDEGEEGSGNDGLLRRS